MTDYRDTVLSLASDLAIGDRSEHLVCPACGGGASHERSLLIWCNVDGITYKCYRAKCSLGGKIGEMGYRPVTKKVRKPRFHTDMLDPEPLPDDVVDYLLGLFPWMSEKMLHINGVMWSETKEKVLYPIKSISGFNEGYLARRYDDLVLCTNNKRSAKALAHYNTIPDDYTLTCSMVPHGAQFDDVVVVYEDFPSALRSNEYIPSIALSGTSIQESTLMSLVKAGKKKVCIVLDADATAKAAKMVYNYALYFHQLCFVPLTGCDPKDMSDEAMDKLIDTVERQLRIQDE